MPGARHLPVLCSARFVKQLYFMSCLLVVFTCLDNGTAAFSAKPPAFPLKGSMTLCSAGGFPGRTSTGNACAMRSSLRPARQLRPAALGLQMQGDSWLDRAIDKLVGDGAYDPTLTGETTEDADSRGYYVILEDDDQHTVDEVVKIVRKVVGCSWKDSLEATLEVGRRGWSVVKQGGQQECEQVRDALRGATLKASVLDEDALERKQEETVETEKAAAAAEETVWKGRRFRNGSRPRITVIGATGRVGAWTVRELMRFCKGDVDFVVAGRNEKAANKLLKQLGGGMFFFGGREWATIRTKLLGAAEFQRVELDDFTSLVAAIQRSDLVIHTAGPFQGAQPEVLRAAIACGTPYMDVCDDVEYSQRCRAMSESAAAEGVTAITTCGIYPGLSNVMAASTVRSFESSSEAEGEATAERLEFSYFTAGTGGVGATILASTFLLLAEKCQVFESGQCVEREPLSIERDVTFGERIGTHRVMLLNLPEVVTAHQVLGVPDVNAAFATAPKFWNTLLKALVQVVPRKLLGNREFANAFAKISLPVNRLVDPLCGVLNLHAGQAFVGSAAGIRVDVSGSGRKTTSLWTGKYLSQAVGVATAAMAMEMLESQKMPSGVLYPEEAVAPERTKPFLDRACKGAVDLELEMEV